MKQMKQLFSPDDSTPAFQQKTCHKQIGSDDCGVFAIAYAIGMFNGIEPDKVIYDQSKMRSHLIQCFEKQQLDPFPIHRRKDYAPTKACVTNNTESNWKVPRRSARLSSKLSQSDKNIVSPNKYSPLSDEDPLNQETDENDDHSQVSEDAIIIDEETLPQKQDDEKSRSSSSIIVNLSKKKLTSSEQSVLEKGLNYGITEKKINKDSLLDDVYKFQRKLKLKEYFSQSEKPQSEENSNDQEGRSDMKGVLKNPYWNPPKITPKSLNVYISAVKNSITRLIKKADYTSIRNNLTDDERIALRNLKEQNEMIIQQADKGGKIVLMDKDDYLKTCQDMLEDTTFYQKEADEKHLENIETIRSTVNELEGLISDKERKYILEDTDRCRMPLFYGLPKIHKSFTKIPPMRPIVSGFNSCTAKLSEFLDSFLKYQAQRCSSYIRDTKDFLCKLDAVKNLPVDTILVTLDVSSLYTNIDQDEGTEACFRKLEKRKNKSFPSEVLRRLIKLVLQNNVFRFGNQLYSQIKGTCMGTPMAPNYANLFMAEFEEELLDEYEKKTGQRPLIWWRYIDDIFCIWTGGKESLAKFIEFAQNYGQMKKMKSDIKFTFDQSTDEVSFLDVCVKINEGVINTTVFSKPTDSHLYLNSNSNHPRHVIRNIPKSQFLRLRRICSSQADFISKSSTYAQYFISRGYEKSKIEEAIREVTKMKREELLTDNPKKKTTERIVFVCDWHPNLAQLPSFLKRSFFHLKNDRHLGKTFQEPPLVAFRRARTIRNEVVRTDHRIQKTKDGPTSTSSCGKCKTCKLISCKTEVTNSKTGRSIPVVGGNCTSKDLIYAASCKRCKMIYIGQTGEELKSRFNKHRYDAKKRPKNCELAKHIQSHPNHDFDQDIEVSILKIGFKNSDERRRAEDKMVCSLGCLVPTGINEQQALGDYAKEMYDIHQNI